MDPNALKAKLLQRVSNEITAAGSPSLPATVLVDDDIIEAARKEYGSYQPKMGLLTFDVTAQDPWVDLPDVELLVIEGAYALDRGYMGGNLPIPEGSSTPSLLLIDAVYRERYGRELSTIVVNGRVGIVPTRTPVIPLQSISADSIVNPYFYEEDRYEGVIVYYYLPSWEEIGSEAENALLKYAISEWIDALTIGIEGIMRIPTGDGYIELDAGRVMSSLSARLRKEFYDQVGRGAGVVMAG